MRFRTLVASCTFVLAVLASNHAADASAILFTDRAAFELAAMPNLNPLRTTDIVVIGGGQFVATYGDILPVFMDIGGPAIFSSIGEVGVIPQGGGSPL